MIYASHHTVVVLLAFIVNTTPVAARRRSENLEIGVSRSSEGPKRAGTPASVTDTSNASPSSTEYLHDVRNKEHQVSLVDVNTQTGNDAAENVGTIQTTDIEVDLNLDAKEVASDHSALNLSSHANSQDQLGRRTSLQGCVSPLSTKGLVDIGTTGNPATDRQEMRSFMFYTKHLAGLNSKLKIDQDVPPKAAEIAKNAILQRLQQIANIKSLQALEELYKIAAGFGIIRRTYLSVTEQTWARTVVDCSLALYDGSDYVQYYKKPEDIEDEPGGFHWKTKFKYARQVFGIANHFFNIYIMTWLPQMEGIIHSHGESACSFKFMTEAEGFSQQGFHDVDMQAVTCAPSIAFKDWETTEHFGQTCRDAPRASLRSLDMTTVSSVGNARRGQVFYIQDDLGVHRFDNAAANAGFTVNVYYPSYEKTWLFSNWEQGTLVHTREGTLKSLTAVKEWLDRYGRDPPYKQMAVWRLPEVDFKYVGLQKFWCEGGGGGRCDQSGLSGSVDVEVARDVGSPVMYVKRPKGG